MLYNYPCIAAYINTPLILVEGTTKKVDPEFVNRLLKDIADIRKSPVNNQFTFNDGKSAHTINLRPTEPDLAATMEAIAFAPEIPPAISNSNK